MGPGNENDYLFKPGRLKVADSEAAIEEKEYGAAAL